MLDGRRGIEIAIVQIELIASELPEPRFRGQDEGAADATDGVQVAIEQHDGGIEWPTSASGGQLLIVEDLTCLGLDTIGATRVTDPPEVKEASSGNATCRANTAHGR